MTANKDKIRASAQKYLQKGQLEKAIKEYQRLVEEDPSDVRTLLKIGDLHTRLGDNPAAIGVYTKVAQAYGTQGFFLKAVAVYKQVLKIDPSLLDINIKLAELYQQLGLLSDAATQYRQVSEIHESQGRVGESLEVLKKLIELDPDNVAGRVKLAELYAREQMMDKARSEYKKAATQLKTQRRIDDYLKVGERLIFFDPADLETTRELANIYIQKNDPKRALAKLQICFKAEPQNIETLELLAAAFKELGQIPKAVSVHREIARLQKTAGNGAGYLAAMRKIAELSPEEPDAKAVLGQQEVHETSPTVGSPVAKIQPAQREVAIPNQVSEVDHRADESDDSIDVDVDEAPAPPTPEELVARLLTEAEVYAKYGLKSKALEHLPKVFQIDPNHRVARVKYKDLLIETKQLKEAAEQLELLANQARARGDNAQAEKDLEELRGLSPAAEPAPTPASAPIPQSVEPSEEVPLLAVEVEAPEEILEAEPMPSAPLPQPAVPAVHPAAKPAQPSLTYEPSAAAAQIDLDEEEQTLTPVVAPVAPSVMPVRVVAKAAPVPLAKDDKSPTTTKPRRPTGSPELNVDLDSLLASAIPQRRPTGPQPAVSLDKPPSAPEPQKSRPASPSAAIPPVEKISPPVARQEPVRPNLAAELEEVTFFKQQGLDQEAQDALAALVEKYPDHPDVLALKKQFDEAAVSKIAAPTEDEPDALVEVGQFDLAAEIGQDLQAAALDDSQVAFKDVFDEFKKGVAKQVEETDYATHYDLGIAYKEMGLIEDAIRELSLAQRAPEKTISSLTMIGLCYLATGQSKKALDVFQQGLNHPELKQQEAVALRFEIAAAYEGMSRFADASKFYERVCALDPTFRDAASRLAEVRRQMGQSEDASTGELDELLAESNIEQSRGKISYL